MSNPITRVRKNNHMTVVFMLMMMAMFQLWDGIMTQVFVSKGIVTELNPLVSGLILDDQFLVIKVIGALLCTIVLLLLYSRVPRLILISTTLITLFYTAVITWNFFIIFQYSV